jgi:cytochrome c oxidase subunit 2
MRRLELLAICTATIILAGLPLGIAAYKRVYLPASHGDTQTIELTAKTPTTGGWSPDVITVHRGDTVRLRITSPDVVHGFAIGRMGIDAGRILPGDVTEVEFVAKEAGRYTFYCNVWCDPDHHRMRGILEVVDPASPDAVLTSKDEPTAVHEDLDIDAPHEARFYPLETPSAARGQAIVAREAMPLPELGDLGSQSPEDVFESIRQDTLLSREEIWDLVAYVWSTTATPESLAAGEALYLKNCTGCHGQEGRGDGPGSRHLAEQPTDFSAPRTMAGGTSEIYYAKIRRGGMGTGMPYWGTIFTQEETRSLVDYLWTFLFKGYR